MAGDKKNDLRPRKVSHTLETLEDVKRKFSTLPMNRWSWPTENIRDEPTRCMRINLEWWPLVAGWLSLLAQPRVWSDVLTADAHPVLQIIELMIGEDCMNFQLRQDPANECLIEQTVDGGETWLPAFDLSLCMSIVDGSSGGTSINNFYTSAFNSFVENVYNNYVENYVDSITDIVPELGYGDADDEFRDDALCYALSKFIDAICEQAIGYFDALDDTANDLRTNLALAGAIIGIVALAATGVGTPAAVLLASQAAMWAASIGVATFLGVALFDHFTETNRAAYDDLAARDIVVCCLLDDLSGADVDRDDFEDAFACAGLATNPQAIHDAAEILATEDATYAAFVENMRIGFNSAKLGLLPGCPCDEDWCYRYDFEASTYEWTLTEYFEWPYEEEGDIGIGGTTGIPVDISLTVGEFVTRFSYTVFGVGRGGTVNVKAYADGDEIYNEWVGNGSHVIPVHRDVTTLRWWGKRNFGWGIAIANVSGVIPDPLLGGDACL